jgi:hypothetical protein
MSQHIPGALGLFARTPFETDRFPADCGCSAVRRGAYITRASGQPDEKPAAVFVDNIPDGYRDWKLISVAHEEGDLKSLGAILGNDVAIKAYREGKLPYPDGTIIAALHWRLWSSMARRRRCTSRTYRKSHMASKDEIS